MRTKRLPFHKASRRSRARRTMAMQCRWRRCYSLVVNRKTPAELKAYILALRTTFAGDMGALLQHCNHYMIVVERPGGFGTPWTADTLAAFLAE